MKTIVNKIMTQLKTMIAVVKARIFASYQATHKAIDAKMQQDHPPSYFDVARDWNYDHYHATVVSRNRWKAATLWVGLPLIGILFLLIICLVPAQHIEPFLVNHYENGLVTVKPMQRLSAPTNDAQVESDIIRYVVNRESYSAATYDYTYNTVLLLSNTEMAKAFLQSQNSTNKNAPINVLGNRGYRTVHVESVVFLDNTDKSKDDKFHQHRNLAQVDFTVIQHEKDSGGEQRIPFTALISWEYRGTPDDPNIRWQNWAGFTVTDYNVQQRSVVQE